MTGIFISHSHGDQPLADALAQLVNDLFGNKVTVHYSSKKELEGGIAPGEDWFRWIVEQVRQADIAFVLLTPASIQKPWVIWEAGAVAGAAYATAAEKARVLPLAFGVRASDIPSPFARTELITGTDEADVLKLTSDLFERFKGAFTPAEMMRFGEHRKSAVQTYIKSIELVLLRLPLTITEAAVQEWLGRLSELEIERRFSEAKVMENWLDVAFGRERDDRQRPFDVRIHRRLGELYASGGQAADAARQFELARQLAPRDIFLLRRLGKAYLDLKETKKVGVILQDIEGLDPSAFEDNSENAALKARWCEQRGDLNGARDALRAAYSRLTTSYYIGDRLGQILVQLDDLDHAREVYRQVRRTLRELREQNVWTSATDLSAALVLEDDAGVNAALEALRERRPSVEDLDSIERGLKPLLKALRRDNAILQKLRDIENRGASAAAVQVAAKVVSTVA
jgi:tetratricopeptide (TPR) repeat protein